MRRIHSLKGSLIATVVLVAAGCGGGVEGPPLYPVTGTVTYQGSPLPGARVTFLPEGKGGVAMGTTNSEGKFTLKTGAEAGVAAGNCKATVIMLEDSGSSVLKKGMTPEDMQKLAMEGKLDAELKKQEKSLIPTRYSKANESGLAFEVKKGSNDIPIELKD